MSAIPNVATGETYEFLERARDTGGEVLRLRWTAIPGARVAAHVHPRQSELFAVEAGTLTVAIDRDEHAVRPGELAEVAAGARHWFANRGSGVVRATLELRPALRMEEVFESLAGFAREGRAGSGGLPRNPLQLAAFAHEYRDEIRSARVPRPLERSLLPPLAWVARMLGYRAHKPEYRCGR